MRCCSATGTLLSRWLRGEVSSLTSFWIISTKLAFETLTGIIKVDAKAMPVDTASGLGPRA
jgi:hypothetical protein